MFLSFQKIDCECVGERKDKLAIFGGRDTRLRYQFKVKKDVYQMRWKSRILSTLRVTVGEEESRVP